MNNITVKDADGTTDVVFVAVTPSAGDKSAAVWMTESTTLPRNFGDELRVSSAPNKAGSVRWLSLSFNHRVVETVNGVPVVTNVVPCTLSFPSLGTITQEELAKAAHRFVNLVGHADVVDQFLSGYAAR